jgi:hypothetical protein
MAARLAVNICIVIPYRITKNFLSIFFIDIPIQLINNIADQEILFENEPDYRKIKSIEIDDALLNNKEQLEDYLILTLNKAIEKATEVNETELAAVAKEGMPNIPGMDMFK